MTVVGIGTDLVDLDRFRQVLARTPSIVDRLFTESEQAYAKERRDPTEPLGVRFAAKEAALKALGLGLGSVGFREIEVIRAESGAPSLLLHGGAAEAAFARGVGRWMLTLSHTSHLAQAVAMAVTPDRRMIPVVTPEEMNAIDRAAPEPVDVLIERAGAAVAHAAIDMLGGTYGRRVVVLAGKGNNGNDGRSATRRLRARGIRVTVLDAAEPRAEIPACDLLIDAAYGTGFRGTYRAPDAGGCGRPGGRHPVGCRRTDGGRVGSRARGGPHHHVRRVEARSSLGRGRGAVRRDRRRRHRARCFVGEWSSRDRAGLRQLVSGFCAPRPTSGSGPCVSSAGAPGSKARPRSTSRAALRAGAGYVRWSAPGGVPLAAKPLEAVAVELPATDWADAALA